VESRYLRRRWDEVPGDEFDGWGHWVWYFELDDGGYPIRQIEVYDAGPLLRYGLDMRKTGTADSDTRAWMTPRKTGAHS
jgi:hypothetical protein